MKLFKKDVQTLLLLLVASIVSVYFMPAIINRLVFLFILLAAWRTNQDYVYLVWFLIINDAPGRLFGATTGVETMRIPLYTLAPGLSLSFQDLFIILYIVKYLTSNRNAYFFLKKEFQIFYMVIALYVVYTIFIGIGYDEFVRLSRRIIAWSFIIVLPAYIPDRATMIRVSSLLFPIVFVAFASQVYTYITGQYLDYQIRGADYKLLLSVEEGGVVSRSVSSSHILLFCTIQALYYFVENKKNEFSKNYLSAVIFLSIFSIFLSATRGWIIAFAVILIGFLLLFGLSGNLSKLLRAGVIAIALFLILTTQFPVLKTQMDMVFERLSTLENIAEGDVTAGGTLSRLDQRGPRVLGKFKDNPILGWGFSRDFYENVDHHVGHHMILLNTGIIGYLYLNGLYIYILFKIFNLSYISGTNRTRAVWIYILAMLAIYAIHSTSSMYWGFDISTTRIMIISLILTAANTVFHQKSNNE